MSGPLEPVLLTEVPTEIEASILQGALADSGIRSVYNGAAVAGFRAEAPAMVRLLVASNDLQAARELIADHDSGSANRVDWARVDVGAPAASAEIEETAPGRTFTVMRSTIVVLIVLSLALLIF